MGKKVYYLGNANSVNLHRQLEVLIRMVPQRLATTTLSSDHSKSTLLFGTDTNTPALKRVVTRYRCCMPHGSCPASKPNCRTKNQCLPVRHLYHTAPLIRQGWRVEVLLTTTTAFTIVRGRSHKRRTCEFFPSYSRK